MQYDIQDVSNEKLNQIITQTENEISDLNAKKINSSYLIESFSKLSKENIITLFGMPEELASDIEDKLNNVIKNHNIELENKIHELIKKQQFYIQLQKYLYVEDTVSAREELKKLLLENINKINVIHTFKLYSIIEDRENQVLDEFNSEVSIQQQDSIDRINRSVSTSHLSENSQVQQLLQEIQDRYGNIEFSEESREESIEYIDSFFESVSENIDKKIIADEDFEIVLSSLVNLLKLVDLKFDNLEFEKIKDKYNKINDYYNQNEKFKNKVKEELNKKIKEIKEILEKEKSSNSIIIKNQLSILNEELEKIENFLNNISTLKNLDITEVITQITSKIDEFHHFKNIEKELQTLKQLQQNCEEMLNLETTLRETSISTNNQKYNYDLCNKIHNLLNDITNTLNSASTLKKEEIEDYIKMLSNEYKEIETELLSIKVELDNQKKFQIIHPIKSIILFATTQDEFGQLHPYILDDLNIFGTRNLIDEGITNQQKLIGFRQISEFMRELIFDGKCKREDSIDSTIKQEKYNFIGTVYEPSKKKGKPDYDRPTSMVRIRPFTNSDVRVVEKEIIIHKNTKAFTQISNLIKEKFPALSLDEEDLPIYIIVAPALKRGKNDTYSESLTRYHNGIPQLSLFYSNGRYIHYPQQPALEIKQELSDKDITLLKEYIDVTIEAMQELDKRDGFNFSYIDDLISKKDKKESR